MCWAKYVPPGASTRAISRQCASTGCRLVTRSKAPSAKGSGGSSSSATTITPLFRSVRCATAMFGGQPSVATVAPDGRCPTPASTSPPPVWMSRCRCARPMRSPSCRWYPQGGRSSVARPSSQEKSQPLTSTAAASAISSSNVRSMEEDDAGSAVLIATAIRILIRRTALSDAPPPARVPTRRVPVPPVVDALAVVVLRPGHHMRHPPADLLIAAGAAGHLLRRLARDRAHGPFPAVRTVLHPVVAQGPGGQAAQ